MSSLASLVSSIFKQAPTPEELDVKITLDSQILAEQFYFFTVVIMWLIHVGFMAYEGGVSRRKNIMSTAMKNILTIAVVTPSFYYFGWYIYGCLSPAARRRAMRPVRVPGFCRHGAVGRADGAEPPGPHQRSLLPRLPALLVDDRLDHVRGAHRARAPLGLPPADRAARLRRLDHGRGLGLERRRLAGHELRLPRRDRLARRPRCRRSVHVGRAPQPRATHREVRPPRRSRAFGLTTRT